MSANANHTDAACPRCAKPLTHRLACAACGALFTDSRLDPFDQLGLPARFNLDQQQLNDRYLALSRLAHPDRHVNADEAAQDQAEAVMALANRARATLADDRLRAEALLARLQKSAGLMPPGKIQPPPEFLMEIMDLTELLAQAADGEKTAITDNIRTRLTGLHAELASVFAVFPPPAPAQAAAQARSLLDRMAYWYRLLENATGAGEHKLVS